MQGYISVCLFLRLQTSVYIFKFVFNFLKSVVVIVQLVDVCCILIIVRSIVRSLMHIDFK